MWTWFIRVSVAGRKESLTQVVVVEVERPLGRNRGKAGADRVFSESDAGGDDRLVGSRRTADGRVDVDLDVEVVSVELGKMKSWLNVAT